MMRFRGKEDKKRHLSSGVKIVRIIRLRGCTQGTSGFRFGLFLGTLKKKREPERAREGGEEGAKK